MWVLWEIEDDGPHQVEQAQVNSMQLLSFYNLSTPNTLKPCCTCCLHQGLYVWQGTIRQMSTHSCCKCSGGRRDGTSKVFLVATETVDAQSTCQFFVQLGMTDVVQEDATTACRCDCMLPLTDLLLTIWKEPWRPINGQPVASIFASCQAKGILQK